MPRCALGLDFGTASVRALVVEVATGEEHGVAVATYPSGVIDERLPGTGQALPPDWALQDAADYWSGMEAAVPQALAQAGVGPADLVGIGVDFTSCTLIPTRADGSPMSADPRWRPNPHAWTKLWKHHAAQPEADRINATATERGERFLERCGGKTSSEWLHAKAWQILDEAADVFAATNVLVEGGDWLVWQLTGELTRSACQAGYKALWSREAGYPDDRFLAALSPGLVGLAAKLAGEIHPIGDRAGLLTRSAASRLGLRAGTPVGVGTIDAHSAVPAAGACGPGTMLLILGTSACHLLLSASGRSFPGIAGVVEDGILPGYFGYEAGQPATGDTFAWFLEAAAPAACVQEARARGLPVHALLEERAAALRPGQCGLLTLDWWNGNRSNLMDAELSGLIVGLTLATRPEDIYRSLIEGSAFGTRAIIDNFVANGVAVNDLFACGGLAESNALLMQVYADVTGRPIRTVRSPQACALGAAILGSVAAGAVGGGHDDIGEAVRQMGGVRDRVFEPAPEDHSRYEEIFGEWMRLHDEFGRGHQPVMKRLRDWRH